MLESTSDGPIAFQKLSTMRKKQTIAQLKSQISVRDNLASSASLREPLNSEKKKQKSKRNPFTKFLQKNDVVEIAIRAPDVPDEGELSVITLLFDQLSIPTNETVSLFKLLIYYEQVHTFEMLLSHMVKNVKANSDKNKVFAESDQQLILGRNDDDNVYDYDEIISDAFSYAITLNKLHIAFYLFKTYEDDVYGNKLLCVKSILNSFKNDETQVNQVLYLEERLFILEKFITFAEYKMALEFLNVMHQQLIDNPKTNFLVYTSNPLKIIIMLLNIVIHLSNKHQNLRFKAQKVRSSLCDIANSIINNSSNMKEVEDMLLDKTYTGIEIIDFIEILDVIEILQNSMVDGIISNMYLGPYERESVLKKSTCYKVFDEQMHSMPGTEALVTKSFRIFEFQNNFSSLKKYFKSQTKIFSCCKKRPGKFI